MSLPPSTTAALLPDPTSRPATVRVVLRRAQPNGGYVFADGLGLLQLDAHARTIVDFRSSTGCAGELVIHEIRIASNGRFGARRLMTRGGRIVESISGVFVDAHTVRGMIRVTMHRCDTGPVRFTGRLS